MCIADIHAAGGRRVVTEIEEVKGSTAFVEADISTPKGADLAVGTPLSAWGRLDLLVNNTGVAYAAGATSWDDSDATWDRILAAYGPLSAHEIPIGFFRFTAVKNLHTMTPSQSCARCKRMRSCLPLSTRNLWRPRRLGHLPHVDQDSR